MSSQRPPALVQPTPKWLGDDIESAPYDLTQNDFDAFKSVGDDSPVTRAAANPNPNVLRALLRHGQVSYWDWVAPIIFAGGMEGQLPPPPPPTWPTESFSPHTVQKYNFPSEGINSPLLQAINSQLPENIATLCEKGALPNGIDIDTLEDFSSLFLRFRPSIPDYYDLDGDWTGREEFLSCMDRAQDVLLTEEEIEERSYQIVPFWCDSYPEAAQLQKNATSIPSLVAAARGSIAIFETLEKAGASTSFWLSSFEQNEVSDPPWTSSLALFTPFHAAIEERNLEMVKHLLKGGFNPNVQPLMAITKCFPPLAAAVALCESPWNEDAFQELSSHPQIDFNLRTPVYQVHFLHFATARLDVRILRRVMGNISLSSAGVTALGHALLHVACLPENEHYIQKHSKKIFESINEVRDLVPAHMRMSDFVQQPPDERTFTAYFEAQDEVVELLIESRTQELGRKDVHGNTALHYLAGHKIPNTVLIEKLRVLPGGEEVWTSCENKCGYTPKDLFEDGEK
ncbi:hypothetical protein G7Y89_g15124 [Cudoniella acicularis]|uniref:Ankyrin n=1 Tax=Cudoniella acicularis TaxID=354080 RepID=A0A8H4VQV7_9HELO|nr:hypothetical protein G7Y89_g15124 [Cudoniella acicularis]